MGTVTSLAGYFFVNWLNGWPSVPLAGLGDANDPVYVLATTMTLASIVFTQIGQVINCRTSTESVFSVGILSNRTVNIGILVEIALIVAITMLPPLRMVFHTTGLQPDDYLYLAVLPFLVLGVDELRKLIRRRIRARRAKADQLARPAR